jgi:hypothetical protein
MRLLKNALTTAIWLAALASPIGYANAAKPAAPAATASADPAPASTPAPAAEPAPAPAATASAQGNVGMQLGDSSSASASSSSSSSAVGIFDNYSIRLGLEGAGPLHFRDTPDGKVEQTTVFLFGPKIAFLFGHELKDIHRFGLQLSYQSVAKADNRSLKFIPIDLIYEIGHPLVLQVLAGYNVQAGTGFESKYGGLSTGMAFRYDFQSENKWSPVTVSPGIVARANVSGDSMQYSTVFLGAQLDVAYDTNN